MTSDPIILGTLKIAVNGAANVDGGACAVADSAAAGKLTVGAGTAITFIGTGP
jgi:hypothetical protein